MPVLAQPVTVLGIQIKYQVVEILALMPSKQKRLTLVAKPAKSNMKEGNPSSPVSSLANISMADMMQACLSGADADSLVERITAEVLKGIEASFNKKVDPVLQKLEACSSKIISLDTRATEAEGRISCTDDAVATHTAKLAEVESKLEMAMEKIVNLENRGRQCNIHIIGYEYPRAATPYPF